MEEAPSLTALTLQHCSIASNGAAALARVATLSELDLCDNPVGDRGARSLAEGAASTLRLLRLERTGLAEAGLSSLTKALQARSCRLRELSLSGNRHMGMGGGLLELGKALRDNTCLTALHLRSVPIGDGALAGFGESLRANVALRSLTLHGERGSKRTLQQLRQAWGEMRPTGGLQLVPSSRILP